LLKAAKMEKGMPFKAVFLRENNFLHYFLHPLLRNGTFFAILEKGAGGLRMIAGWLARA
jgi:hypothetical protein